MENTSIKFAILIFWLASMIWLVTTKMLPISVDSQPTSGHYFATPTTDTASGRWRISAQGTEVGWTEMKATRLQNGSVLVRTELELKDLKLDNFAKELFSGWSGLLKYIRTPDPQMMITLQAHTNIQLGPDGGLEQWDMVIGLADTIQQIRIEGNREGEEVNVRLSLVATEDAKAAAEQLFQTKIRLPRAALVVDAFTPQPRLANLRVGDRWRFESFQSFPPSSTPHVVEATVERTELMIWDSDIQSTFVVNFRDISGNRPTISEGAYSTVWVLTDGTVVKQLTRFASIELGFERLPIRDFSTESE